MNSPHNSPDAQLAYIVREGIQTGPYTRADLRRYWALGRLQATDQVWTEGMESCEPLINYLAGRPMVLARA